MRINCVVPKFGFQGFITLVLSLFIGALVPGSLRGQATSAILGNVTDATGAALAGATVTVRDIETGVARTTVTEDTGDYRVLSLPVGQYEVRVEKTGFKAGVRSGISLVVAQQAVVNVQLEVGQVTQSVTVTGEAELVNTTASSTAGLVAEQQVKDLPLNGRSFDLLMTLDPGVANFTSQKTGSIPGISNSTVGNNFSCLTNGSLIKDAALVQ